MIGAGLIRTNDGWRARPRYMSSELLAAVARVVPAKLDPGASVEAVIGPGLPERGGRGTARRVAYRGAGLRTATVRSNRPSAGLRRTRPGRPHAGEVRSRATDGRIGRLPALPPWLRPQPGGPAPCAPAAPESAPRGPLPPERGPARCRGLLRRLSASRASLRSCGPCASLSRPCGAGDASGEARGPSCRMGGDSSALGLQRGPGGPDVRKSACFANFTTSGFSRQTPPSGSSLTNGDTIFISYMAFLRSIYWTLYLCH